VKKGRSEVSVQISDARLPPDLEALRCEMDDLRIVRLALSVLDSRLTADLAPDEFRAELRRLLEHIEAKERQALQVMITTPLLNHAGMDVIAALRALSGNGLSVVLV
jgi:hypothetical protein